MIFEFAASEWMTGLDSCFPLSRISHHHFGTHVQVEKTKTFYLPHEDDNMNSNPARMSSEDKAKAEKIVAQNAAIAARRVLPELLFVDNLARHVMYDTFIGFRDASDGLVKQNPDLYCEDNLNFGDTSAPDFGVRIQDFRRPGLEERVIEEYERLDESYQQFVEKMGKMEKKERSPGYILLPGNENFVFVLEPQPVCGFAAVLQNYPAGSEHHFHELEERMQEEWDAYRSNQQ